MLGMLRDWTPQTMVIGFKLETDAFILERKALQSLARYQLHAVVANLLQTRNEEVRIISVNGVTVIRCLDTVDSASTTLTPSTLVDTLEPAIVATLVTMHAGWMAAT